ncbi:MAG: glycosyltransferase [Ignavibacteriales bacterium]|nr:glycosyltransferase [Ignavibacteriales bacterium]MCF8435932.1 glycosyltransferase [Ignavibacteriales bacterium]
MRIVILSAAYPYRGGISSFAAQLYRELAPENETAVVTFTRQYPGFLFPGKTQFEKDRSEEIPAIRLLDSLNPLTWFKTARYIADLNPDVLIIKYWTPFFALPFSIIARKCRKRNIRVLAICHNVLPHERLPFDKKLTKYFLDSIDKIFLLSGSVEKELLAFSDSYNYRILFHPVYSKFGEIVPKQKAREKLGISDGKLLLFFGFIREYKGLDILLKAMNLLRELKGIKLIVAGEFYSGREELLKMVSDMQIQDIVRFDENFIPSDMVRYYFSASDLVVLPYRDATQSGITQIAYNFLKPVLVTRVGSLPEIVSDGKTGLLCRPEDPHDLAGKIKQFFLNEGDIDYKGNISNELQKKSWARFVSDLLEIV